MQMKYNMSTLQGFMLKLETLSDPAKGQSNAITVGQALVNAIEKRRYGSWEELIQYEFDPVDSQHLTLECFLGVSTTSCEIVSRWKRTSTNKFPVRFDILSRFGVQIPPPIGLGSFLTHPRYSVQSCMKSIEKLRRLATEVQNIIHPFLSNVETIVLDIAFKNSRMPLKFQHRIPVLIGDTSLYGDAKETKHKVFYIFLRAAINTHISKTGIVFYASPRSTKHRAAPEKAMWDYIAAFPRVIETDDSNFFPRKYRHHFDREPPHAYVFIGKDTTSFSHEIKDASRFSKIHLNDFNRLKWTTEGPRPQYLVNVPFNNLGTQRALTIILKMYCDRHVDQDHLCWMPCYPKGWVQDCNGGRLYTDRSNRVKSQLMDSLRPSWYCHAKRQEMRLTHQRHLCENILGYNLSDYFSASRSKIKNCRLIIGTGNVTECRKAVKIITKVQLPSNSGSISAGFRGARSVGYVLDEPLKRIMVRGPYKHSFLKSISSGVNRTRIRKIGFHPLEIDMPPRRFYDYSLLLEDIEMSLTRLCHTPIGYGRVYIAENSECMLVAFLLELLIAFGAVAKTEVVFGTAPGILKGLPSTFLESDPKYTLDLFSLGPHHWRDVGLKINSTLAREMRFFDL